MTIVARSLLATSFLLVASADAVLACVADARRLNVLFLIAGDLCVCLVWVLCPSTEHSIRKLRLSQLIGSKALSLGYTELQTRSRIIRYPSIFCFRDHSRSAGVYGVVGLPEYRRTECQTFGSRGPGGIRRSAIPPREACSPGIQKLISDSRSSRSRARSISAPLVAYEKSLKCDD
jgi:hypothetical protein